MTRYLLDSSFVVDLLNEIADHDDEGAALQWLRRNRRAKLWISPVTLAEVLEGAEDVDAVRAYLSRYGWQASTASRPRPRRVCSAVPSTAWVKTMPGRPQ